MMAVPPSTFIDEKGNTKHVEDGSNAIYIVKGSGTSKHYEYLGYSGYDTDPGAAPNLKTLIQESQNLNASNPSLVPDGQTYCNFATQNVMKAVESTIEPVFSMNKNNDVVINGRANDMAPKLDASGAYIATDKAGALDAAKSGNLAVMSYVNPQPGKSGHVATLSVGDNLSKGPVANIGGSNGFKSISKSFGNLPVKYYILNPNVQTKDKPSTLSFNNQL
ncbi:hypothetical protein [Pedobacter nutrimenti]|uniref:hypothetical protein n=1 Tax=Pedobacter nutrimenti TaxID=1241337 RepID=UPI00292DFA5A|nr:hypothetical protein [Pedobacter nutrimenti]